MAADIWVPKNVSDLLDWSGGTLTAPGGDIPMGGHGPTGMRAAAAAGEAVRYEEAAQGIFTTKGDLLVASGAHASARLAVGADGTRLEADSTATNGVKWSTKDAILVAASGAAVSHTGDTAETVLATIAIPAGIILANGQVQIIAFFTRNGSGTSNVQAAMRFGATGSGTGGTLFLGAPTVVLTNAQLSNIVLGEFANANSASSQIFHPLLPSAAPYNTPSATTAGTAAINTANATEINITGKCVNGGDTITLKYYRVLVYPKA